MNHTEGEAAVSLARQHIAELEKLGRSILDNKVYSAWLQVGGADVTALSRDTEQPVDVPGILIGHAGEISQQFLGFFETLFGEPNNGLPGCFNTCSGAAYDPIRALDPHRGISVNPLVLDT